MPTGPLFVWKHSGHWKDDTVRIHDCCRHVVLVLGVWRGNVAVWVDAVAWALANLAANEHGVQFRNLYLRLQHPVELVAADPVHEHHVVVFGGVKRLLDGGVDGWFPLDDKSVHHVMAKKIASVGSSDEL